MQIDSGILGIIIGSLISLITDFVLQKGRNKHEIKVLKERNKNQYAAEETALHYLSDPRYSDRSFEVISKKIAGFKDDELRQILVRARAIRGFDENGKEWWRLLSRNAESTKSAKRR